MTIIELSRIAVKGYIIFLIIINCEAHMGVLLHFFYNKQGTNSIRVDIKFFSATPLDRELLVQRPRQRFFWPMCYLLRMRYFCLRVLLAHIDKKRERRRIEKGRD